MGEMLNHEEALHCSPPFPQGTAQGTGRGGFWLPLIIQGGFADQSGSQTREVWAQRGTEEGRGREWRSGDPGQLGMLCGSQSSQREKQARVVCQLR